MNWWRNCKSSLAKIRQNSWLKATDGLKRAKLSDVLREHVAPVSLNTVRPHSCTEYKHRHLVRTCNICALVVWAVGVMGGRWQNDCVASELSTDLWSLYVPHSGHYTYRTAVTICTAQRSLYVPHSGHYTYRTAVTICTASLTFNNSTFCPHSVFMCFVWIWEQTAIISLYNINWLVCITETECVYCAVRTGSFFILLLLFFFSFHWHYSPLWVWPVEQCPSIILYI